MRLDPDDLIFPRNPTRVGPKYQTTCPSCDPDSGHGGSHSICDTWVCSDGVFPAAGDLDRDVLFERGGDLTIEIMSSLCNLSNEDGALCSIPHVLHVTYLEVLL